MTQYPCKAKELKLKRASDQSESVHRLISEKVSNICVTDKQQDQQPLHHDPNTAWISPRASLESQKVHWKPPLAVSAALPGMAERYCVGSDRGRAVRPEGRMIIHSKPRQHGLCSIWDIPAQYNGLIRIMVVVTGFVFFQVILSICTLNRIQYLQVYFVRGLLQCRHGANTGALSVCLRRAQANRKCSAIMAKNHLFSAPCFPFMKYVYSGCFYLTW